MDPPTPVPYTSESLLTHELPASAIDSLVEAVGPGSGSQLASVELRHSGGALSRAPHGRRSARLSAGLLRHLRGRLRPGAGGNGANPRLARRLQVGARAL